MLRGNFVLLYPPGAGEAAEPEAAYRLDPDTAVVRRGAWSRAALGRS